MKSLKQEYIERGIIFQDDFGKWNKRCPSCRSAQPYWSYSACINHVKKNTKCNSCSKDGKNNPSFGKSPSSLTRQKLSVSGKGKHQIPCPPDKKKRISETKKKTDISTSSKIGNNQYKRKPYTFPNGTVVWVQGYEPWTLDYLLSSSINPNDIKVSGKERPIISYDWSGSTNRYIPDCFVTSSNMVVETKSPWTWNSKLHQNLSKLTASLDSGYTTRLIIWGHNKTLVLDETFYPNSV